MKLFIGNNSSDDDVYEYSVGTLTIPAGTVTEVDKLYWTKLYENANFINDIRLNNITVNDGNKTYSYPESETYIEKVRLFVIEVVTQFEKDDKILKLASTSAEVDENSIATISIRVPGTPGSDEGRFIAGGSCWFDIATQGDKIIRVEVVDVDNLMGYGAGLVLRTWHDEEVAEEDQGWYFPIHKPILSVEPIGGYGFIPSGFYLRVVAEKANDLTEGTLYLNLFWAKGEQ